MKPNPDDIYWQRAALEPLAPATLWLYPELSRVDPSRQRPMLNEAKRRALHGWTSYLLLGLAGLAAVIIFWAIVTDQFELRRSASYVMSPAMLVWFVFCFVRTRQELRSALSRDPGVAGGA